MSRCVIWLWLAWCVASPIGAEPVLRVGATLPVYGSWLLALGGDRLEAVAVVPPDVDPHVYRPRPQDLERLRELDAVVENGAHDPWLDAMLRAALDDAADALPRIRPAASDGDDGHLAGHGFLSVVAATEQIRKLAEALARLDPDAATAYRDRAEALIRRLRTLLLDGLAALDAMPGAREIPIAVVHDGYARLFGELGLTLRAVVQPRHGVEPSARQLADTIRRLREAEVRVLFTEMELAPTTVEVIERETGCRLARLDHLARGVATAERYERGMARNVDTIVAALRAAVGDAVGGDGD